jgi:hypothetical protein|tara:strand:- start:983 stop:1801 length:819 start_codon:yes stop_codon:yes gene_type:complete
MTEFDNAVEAYKNHLMETDVARKNTFLQLARNIANVSKDDDITIENVKEEATKQVKQELEQKEQQKKTQQSASKPKKQGFISPNSLTGKVKQMLSRKKKNNLPAPQTNNQQMNTDEQRANAEIMAIMMRELNKNKDKKQPQEQTQAQTQRVNPDDLVSQALAQAKKVQGGKTSLQQRAKEIQRGKTNTQSNRVRQYTSPPRQSIPLPKDKKMDNIMEKVKAIKDPNILARIKQIIDDEEKVGKSLRIIRDDLPSSDLINKMKINQILKMIEE